MPDNRRVLYDNLISSNKVTKEEVGDFETFSKLLDNPEDVSAFHSNLISNNIATEEELGDLNTFSDYVKKKDSTFVSPKKPSQVSSSPYQDSGSKSVSPQPPSVSSSEYKFEPVKQPVQTSYSVTTQEKSGVKRPSTVDEVIKGKAVEVQNRASSELDAINQEQSSLESYLNDQNKNLTALKAEIDRQDPNSETYKILAEDYNRQVAESNSIFEKFKSNEESKKKLANAELIAKQAEQVGKDLQLNKSEGAGDIFMRSAWNAFVPATVKGIGALTSLGGAVNVSSYSLDDDQKAELLSKAKEKYGEEKGVQLAEKFNKSLEGNQLFQTAGNFVADFGADLELEVPTKAQGSVLDGFTFDKAANIAGSGVGSMAAMLLPAGAMGKAGKAAQLATAWGSSSLQTMGGVYEEARAAGLSDSEAAYLSLAIALPVGAVDAVSGARFFGSRRAAKELVDVAVKELSGRTVTPAILSEVADRSVKTMIKDRGIDILQEGFTGAVQQGIEEGVKAGYDEATGDNTFKTKDAEGNYDFVGAGKRIFDSAFGEAFGAGFVNTISGSKDLILKKGKITESAYDQAVKVGKDAASREYFRKMLETSVKNGVITQDEADNVKKNINAIIEADKLIPSSIKKVEKRVAAVELLREKNSLEAQIEGKDKSLTVKQQERIKAIDSELQDIAMGKPSPTVDSKKEEKLSAQPTATDPKADIERRRQEDINKNTQNINTADVRRPNGGIGTQGFDPSQMKDLVSFLNDKLGLNIPKNLLDKNNDSLKALIDFIKDNNLTNKIIDYVKSNPSETITLPDGTIEFKDGNHRANLLNILGSEILPTIDQSLLKEINAKYDAELAALEAKPTVTPSVSDKKADIERRRQEELKERVIYDRKPTVEDGEFRIVGDPNKSVYRINENTGRLQVKDRETGLWTVEGTHGKIELETAQRSGFEKLKEAINAKYDAELDALEEKQSAVEPEEITALRKAKELVPLTPEEQAKLDEYDSKNKPGVSSEVGGGETSIQTEPLKKEGEGSTQASGVVQAQEKVQPVKDQVKSISNNTKDKVDAIKSASLETEDGATFNLDGTIYEGGGVVIPVTSSPQMSQAEITPEKIQEFVEANMDKIPEGSTVKPGIYKFPNSDKVSIDLNIVVPKDKADVALEFAKRSGQESIFDLDTFENRKTGATGESPAQYTSEQFYEIADSLSKGVLPKAVTQQQAPDTDAKAKFIESKKQELRDDEDADYNESLDPFYDKYFGELYDFAYGEGISAEESATREKILGEVDRVKSALSSVAPGVKIVSHGTTDSFRQALKDAGSTDEELQQTRLGGGFYDPNTNEIHLNLPEVRSNTLLHEGVHPILNAIEAINPDVINKLYDQVVEVENRQGLIDERTGQKKYSEDFAGRYFDKADAKREKLKPGEKTRVQKMEAVTEFLADVADGTVEINQSNFDKVKQFFVDLMAAIGIDVSGKIKTVGDLKKLADKISSAFKTGEEITFNDSEYVDSNGNKISDKNLQFSLNNDFSDVKTKISFVYLSNNDKFKKLKEAGFITNDKKLSDFNGKYIFLHSPDAAFSGDIFKNGELLIEGKGGIYYPIKFHEDGYFWASTKGGASSMAKQLNEALRLNNGTIYMALTSAPADKLLSSTTASIGVLDLFSSKVMDNAINIKESDVKSAVIKAAKSKIIVNNKSVGLGLKDIDSKASLKDINSIIKQKLSPDKSTFGDRKHFVEELINNVVNNVKGKKTEQKLADFFHLGIQNPNMKGVTKKGYNLSKANVVASISHMLQEPLLRNEKGSGNVYAILEVNGEIEPVDSEKHESYPKALKAKNGGVKLHILQDRLKWSDNFQDPATGDIVTKDRQLKIFPTSGVSTSPLKLAAKKVQSQKPVKGDLIANSPKSKFMTEDGEGNYVFYHYSSSDLSKKGIDPNKTGKNIITSKSEKLLAPASFYYTEPNIQEPGTGEYAHVVKVPKNKVYPYNEDPLNFAEEAERRFREKYPNQAFDANKELAWVSVVAAENGYDVTVANWDGLAGFKQTLRAQSPVKLKPEMWKKPKPGYYNAFDVNDDLEFKSNRRKPQKQLPPKEKSEAKKIFDANFNDREDSVYAADIEDLKTVINVLYDKIDPDYGARVDARGDELSEAIDRANWGRGGALVREFLENIVNKLDYEKQILGVSFDYLYNKAIDSYVNGDYDRILEKYDSLKNKPQRQQPESEITPEELKAVLDLLKTRFAGNEKALTKGLVSTDKGKDLLARGILQEVAKKTGSKPGASNKSRVEAVNKRLIESENIPEELRAKIQAEGTISEVFSNDEAKQIADGYINELGVDEAVKLADEGYLKGSVKMFVYGAAIDNITQQINEAKTQEEKDALADKGADIAASLQADAEQYGRFIQAIGTYYKQSPLIIAKREVNRLNKASQDAFNRMVDKKDKVSRTNQGLNYIRKKNVDPEAIKKIKTPKNEKEKASELNKLRDLWSSLKAKGARQLSDYSDEQIDVLHRMAVIFYADGKQSFASLYKALKEETGISKSDFNELINSKLPADISPDGMSIVDLANEVNKPLVERVSKEKVEKSDIEKILDSGNRKKAEKSQNVPQKLYAIYGDLNKENRKKMYEDIKNNPDKGEDQLLAEWSSVLNEQQQQAIIDKHFPEKPTENKEKRKAEHEKIIDAYNSGIVNNKGGDKFKELFFDKFGLPKTNTEEMLNYIDQISQKLAKAPEGSIMWRETYEDLLDYIADNTYKNAIASGMDKLSAMWYANILSSPATHLRNLQYNAAQALILNPLMIFEKALLKGDLGQLANINKGMIEGLKKGAIETGRVFRTGRGTRFDGIMERSLADRKLKLWSPVGRALRGSDIFFSDTAYQLKLREFARAMVKEEHPGWNNDEVNAKVNDLMGQTKERKEFASKQAEQELNAFYGENKPKDYETIKKIREFEIIEQTMPDNLKNKLEESKNWAKKSLLTNRPTGLFGVVSDLVGTLNKKLYVTRFIIPFINVPLNVAQAMIERSPFGLIKAASTNTLHSMSDKFEYLNPDQKRELTLKAINYTVGMVLLAMMNGDDDDDGLVITGNMTGNYLDDKNIERSGGLKPMTVNYNGVEIMSYKTSPFAPLLLPAGLMRDAKLYGETKNTTDAIANAFINYMLFINDASAMQGLQGFFGAMADKKLDRGESIRKWFGKQANALTPYSGAVKFITNTVNAAKGEDDTRPIELYEYVVKDLPFIQDLVGVSVRTDHFGQPIKEKFDIPLVPVGQRALVDKYSDISPYYKAMRDKDYLQYLKFPTKRTFMVGGKEVEISKKELNDLNARRGEIVRKALDSKNVFKSKLKSDSARRDMTTIEYLKTLDNELFKERMDQLFDEAGNIARIEKFGEQYGITKSNLKDYLLELEKARGAKSKKEKSVPAKARVNRKTLKDFEEKNIEIVIESL